MTTPTGELEVGGEVERDTGAASHPFARFWKCALQVNPEGYSKAYRGQDHGLEGKAFLEALLEECQTQAIALIGLADHGSVADVDAIRTYLTPHGIVVLPGFEVCTTEKVDWVCLFSEETPTDDVRHCLSTLGLDLNDRKRPLRIGGDELLAKVQDAGGFCYAAHVTGRNGLLKAKLHHLWRNPRLLAAQIPGSVDGLPQEFRQIAANADPAYHRDRPLALINAKDVDRPDTLREPGASCCIKMTRPGFEALRTAFKDPAARVRRHDEINEIHYSEIRRLRISGGYLDGIDIRFSPHLNTIIGGRGSGKSTLVESLRYALGLDHRTPEARKQGDSIIRENLGKAHGQVTVDIVSAHQRMLPYRIVRRYGEPARVIDASGDESALTVADLLPGIEVYGQNEIYELARDENALIAVLDRFLPDKQQHERTLAQLQRKLKANGERLDAAEEQREELEQQLRQLPALEEQARQFGALGLQEKLELVPLLEKERQLPERMTEEVERLSSGLEALRDSLPDTTFLSDKALEGLPHADTILRVRAALERIATSTEARIVAMTAELDVARAEVVAAIVDLDGARKEAEKALDAEFAKLPAVAGQDGTAVGRSYQAVRRRIESIRPQQAKLTTATELVAALSQERRNLLGELSSLRNTRTRALEREAARLNEKLAGQLRLTVRPNANRQKLRTFLSQLPGIGDKSVEWVKTADDLTIPALVTACRAGSSALLAMQWGVTPARAETICKLARAQLLELETIDLDDRVALELNVAHEGEAFRPLERLSTGQQCTAILHLLLLDNPDPLVMDQPEDNLDNAFIAERIVQQLRSAKTSRQFLFATHNANIPVFGDAEWIGVFTATQDRGSVPPENQGSIDVPRIRDQAARILDGGREAFLQRQEKYGY